MGSSTLLVRHLPASLTKEEKEDFLRHFGAIKVRVMGNKGPLKHTAFAEFSSADVASQVVNKLHQVDVLGCRLVVELARSRHEHLQPTLDDSQPNTIKEEAKEEKEKDDTKEEEKEEDGDVFDISFQQWGLKYPRRRRLNYLYPPPSPSILTNICNALAACPRFYVQVLHLMNKMDLPAPFGPLTAQPPMVCDTVVGVSSPDKLEMEEMVVSSTEESEMESDTEPNRPGEETVAKKKRKSADDSRSAIRKRARLAMAMFQPSHQPPVEPRPSALARPLGEVFEQTGETSSQKKIQLRLPSAVSEGGITPTINVSPAVNVHSGMPPAMNVHLSMPPAMNFPPAMGGPPTLSSVPPHAVTHSTAVLPPVPQADGMQTAARAAQEMAAAAAATRTTSDTKPTEEEAPQSSGFGIITPMPKQAEEKEDDTEEESWSKGEFISRSELRKGRLSDKERQGVSVFRNYQPGEPSRRLYIKNLSKQVTEQDLHWIFGRYVNWDNEAEKNMFDIRLMKEGRMKGQAFVTLGTEEQAVKAVRDTNAFLLKDKPMAVTFARSAKQQDEGKS